MSSVTSRKRSIQQLTQMINEDYCTNHHQCTSFFDEEDNPIICNIFEENQPANWPAEDVLDLIYHVTTTTHTYYDIHVERLD
mmetsp:Transcript_40593/g.70942  ORF Transcript_40593/g.70942 Transcript_40593/m.70942 type:complete len:82 (+) Transcript_40593:248-493(+)